MSVTPNPIKAEATRQAAQDYARKNLKLDFVDAPHWRELAAAAAVRLPVWYLPATAGRIQRYAEGIGLSIVQIAAATGCKSYRSLATTNPTWPLFAVVGLLLELKEELNLG
ncbi:hypothetical protein [Pseudomonas sp. 1152_12]|uniref:hypothetical protein n=1 Tax=Pseudomonas sp. 1152_12 TaxID=2604455 RepID=UPI004063BCD2